MRRSPTDCCGCGSTISGFNPRPRRASPHPCPLHLVRPLRADESLSFDVKINYLRSTYLSPLTGLFLRRGPIRSAHLDASIRLIRLDQMLRRLSGDGVSFAPCLEVRRSRMRQRPVALETTLKVRVEIFRKIRLLNAWKNTKRRPRHLQRNPSSPK